MKIRYSKGWRIIRNETILSVSMDNEIVVIRVLLDKKIIKQKIDRYIKWYKKEIKILNIIYLILIDNQL